MNPPWPTAAESASLRFLLPFGGLRFRTLAAAALFAAGVTFACVVPLALAPIGLVAILVGHLVLWVRTQTTAPGGATPAHEEVWAPVEDDWLQRIEAHEKRGARWDVTPWDISNVTGCFLFLVVLLALATAASFVLPWLGPESALRLAATSALLFLPLWLNGMRSTWNPSELRKKGQALAEAREAAVRLGAGHFDVVPTLALREGRRGKYPVDARLMLRPRQEDATGFLGVQIQVALNNVRGTDYPYLYAVILGKPPFEPPPAKAREHAEGVDLVLERGQGDGVRYLVVRQHADRQGGWHTETRHIIGIVAVALARALAAWRASGGRVA